MLFTNATAKTKPADGMKGLCLGIGKMFKYQKCVLVFISVNTKIITLQRTPPPPKKKKKVTVVPKKHKKRGNDSLLKMLTPDWITTFTCSKVNFQTDVHVKYTPPARGVFYMFGL